MFKINMLETDLTNKRLDKIAIFYAFLKCQGGGERLMFTIRDYFKADFWTGAIDSKIFSPENSNSFSKHLYNGIGKVYSLHEDSSLPIWYIIKRQLFFIFSPRVQDLALNYDKIILSGNISFVARRLRKIAKKHNKNLILEVYVHTPPRLFTDQKEKVLNKIPTFFKLFVDKLMTLALKIGYIDDMKVVDTVFTNSINIQNRLLKYCGIESKWIFPPVDLDRFKYISTGDYFLSYCRLEDNKRIKLIVETFKKLPDKKLIICSTGPLKNWVIENIKDCQNITYEGMVSDERLNDLVGNCLAGITIPINEDAGITQLEIMSAGKPVIGVKEGGILETVIEGETGLLVKSEPNIDDLVEIINRFTPELALKMKEKSRLQAENYSIDNFFKNWE
jgi:glycosyltransferase involved in cell wall biosynthesis